MQGFDEKKKNNIQIIIVCSWQMPAVLQITAAAQELTIALA